MIHIVLFMFGETILQMIHFLHFCLKFIVLYHIRCIEITTIPRNHYISMFWIENEKNVSLICIEYHSMSIVISIVSLQINDIKP